MNMQRVTVKLAVVIFCLYGYGAAVQAGEHILIPKIGVVDRNDNINHSANNDSFDLDDELVASAGFTYLYRLDNGFAVGAEVFGYENDIVTTINNNGDVTTSHVYGIVEKTFNIEGNVKPYVGAGLGFVSMKFDGHINGEIDDDSNDFAAGLSYEIFAGTEIKINDRVGVRVEYKYYDFDVDDDIGDKNFNIESDGSAVFVGVAIHL